MHARVRAHTHSWSIPWVRKWVIQTDGRPLYERAMLDQGTSCYRTRSSSSSEEKKNMHLNIPWLKSRITSSEIHCLYFNILPSSTKRVSSILNILIKRTHVSIASFLDVARTTYSLSIIIHFSHTQRLQWTFLHLLHVSVGSYCNHQAKHVAKSQNILK